MKVKNANFFLLHLEKFVLGAALLFLLVMADLYLLGNPYAVEVGGEVVGPVELEQQIAEAADQLRTALDNPEPPIDPRPVPDYTANFVRRWEQPPTNIEPPYVLAHLWPQGVGEAPKPPTYYVPRPPVPDTVIARASYAVLGEVPTPEMQEALIQLTGATEPPRDFRYVSVESEFPMSDWIDRLSAAPPEPGLEPIRDAWWRPMLHVSAVYLQRQELNPVTGEWSEPVTISPLPYQTAFLPSEQRQWTREEADQVVTFIKEYHEQIVRPEFVPTAGGQPWMPPGQRMRELSPQEQRELQETIARIQKLQSQIQMLQRRLGIEEASAPNELDMPALIGDAGNRRGAVVDPRLRQPRIPRDADPRLQQRLEDARAEVARLMARRNELLGIGEDGPKEEPQPGMGLPYEEPGMPTDPYRGLNPRRDNRLQRGATAGEAPDSDTEAEAQTRRLIRVWAHDLTVEPGRTYRYRVVVAVLNPLFQQTRLTEEQKQQYSNQLALAPAEEELAAAPWSDPVQIDPEYYFFLVGGRPERQTAEVEVWRIFNGAWRRHQFEVNPGDPIGGVAEVDAPKGTLTLPMRVDSIMVDLIQLAAAGPGALLGGDVRMFYFDRDAGRIAFRTLNNDRNHPDRIRLQNEAAMTQAFAAAPAQ